LKGKWHFGATFIDNEGKNVIGCIYLMNITGKKLDTSSTRHGLRDQDHFCTRLRRDVNYRLTLHQNLAEADVKFELVIFFYIFFILYAINDILLYRMHLSDEHHRRSWHGPPPFSNFLYTNLFSITFLYFFIISSLFPYFNLFVSIFIQSYCPKMPFSLQFSN
jgi:hypothetical protein